MVKKPLRAPRKAMSGWAKFAHFMPYAFNNSPAGIAHAKRLGYKAIDLDAHVTSDGRIVITHWALPLLYGFVDPLGLIPKNTPIWRMTYAEVRRLRYKQGGYRIYSAGTMLRLAKRAGLRVEFECKNSPQFGTDAPWVRLRKAVKATGVNLQVKTINNVGAGGARLRAAHRNGFTTILLPRGNRRVSREWWAFIDYVRGPVVWVK